MKTAFQILATLIFLFLSQGCRADWQRPVAIDSFTDLNALFPKVAARNDSIFVIYGNNMFQRSLDNGQTWQDKFTLPQGGFDRYYDFEISGDTLILCYAFVQFPFNYHFYYSTDFGQNWQGPRDISCPGDIEFSSMNYDHNIVSICTETYQGDAHRPISLMTSQDLGLNWTEPESLYNVAMGAWVFFYYFYHNPYIFLAENLGWPYYSGLSLLFAPDGGQSWVDVSSLGRGGNGGYQEMAASADGKMAYVFHDWNSWIDLYSRILVSASSDSGYTWTEPVVISVANRDYYPRVAISGDTIVVAWDGKLDSSSLGSGILIRRSFNLGNSWQLVEFVADSAFTPDIEINNSSVYLVNEKYSNGYIMLYSQIWEPGNESTDDPPKPERASLLACYPNPFNSSTVIHYTTENSGINVLSIFNLAGQRVAILYSGYQTKGQHKIVWLPDGLPSGVYFARLETSGTFESMKMLFLK